MLPCLICTPLLSQHQVRWHSVIQYKYYIWDTSFTMSQPSVTLPTFTHLTSGESAEPHNRCGTCDWNTRPKYSQNKTPLVLLRFTLQTVTISLETKDTAHTFLLDCYWTLTMMQRLHKKIKPLSLLPSCICKWRSMCWKSTTAVSLSTDRQWLLSECIRLMITQDLSSYAYIRARIEESDILSERKGTPPLIDLSHKLWVVYLKDKFTRKWKLSTKHFWIFWITEVEGDLF